MCYQSHSDMKSSHMLVKNHPLLHIKPLCHSCGKLIPESSNASTIFSFFFLMREGSETFYWWKWGIRKRKKKDESTMEKVILYSETCFSVNQLVTVINWIIQLESVWMFEMFALEKRRKGRVKHLNDFTLCLQSSKVMCTCKT